MVIASGEATTFAGHGLNLSLEGEGARAEVRLTFVADPEVPDVAVRSTLAEHGYDLECVNFDGADGRGSAVPVFLGGIGTTGVFFHFRVFRHGRSDDRTVHYTFYEVPDAVIGPPEDPPDTSPPVAGES